MMNPMDRFILPTKSLVVKKLDIAAERVGIIETVKEAGEIRVKPQMVGEDMIFIEAFKGKGTIDPVHQHDDHESIGYLLSGVMRMVIDGEEYILEQGDAWRHPRGVPHLSEAIEDCVQLEIKSPPRKTWYTESEIAAGKGQPQS
jgi:mannose-6-phosphate isomerase-like protein (cupin superfamily)